MKRIVFLAVVGCLWSVFAGPAWSQTYVGVTPPNVGPVEVGQPSVGGGAAPVGGAGVAAQVLPARVAALSPQGRDLSVAAAQGGQVRIQPAPVRALAITGADIAALVAIALFSVIIGAVLVRRARPAPR